MTFSVAGGDRRFKGEIYAQDPRIDAATRTVLVRAWCDNPGCTAAAGRVRQRGAGAGRARRGHPGALGGGDSRDSTKSTCTWSARTRRRSGAPWRRARGSKARCTFCRDSTKATSSSPPGLQQMRPGQLIRTARRVTHDARRNQHSTAGVHDRDVGADHAVRRHRAHASLACANIRRWIRRRSRSPRLMPGAAAEVVQAQITEPIEEALNTVAGIQTLTSTSREGASQISAEFSLDTNLETAASDVRDQLARAVRYLPPDVNPPILNKADADSTPIFGLALSSGTRTQLELGAYANTLEREAADRARHRLGRSARGEALCDAPVDGSREAHRLQPLAARRARRHRAREHRAALGPHRRRGHRVAGQDPVATEHARGIQCTHRQAHRRQRGALPRHRLRGARRGQRTRRAQDGRYADRRPVFQAAARRQPDRDRRRVARAARADPQGDSRRHQGRRGLRQHRVRAALAARGDRDHLHRLRCWWCWWCSRSCASGARR